MTTVHGGISPEHGEPIGKDVSPTPANLADAKSKMDSADTDMVLGVGRELCDSLEGFIVAEGIGAPEPSETAEAPPAQTVEAEIDDILEQLTGQLGDTHSVSKATASDLDELDAVMQSFNPAKSDELETLNRASSEFKKDLPPTKEAEETKVEVKTPPPLERQGAKANLKNTAFQYIKPLQYNEPRSWGLNKLFQAAKSIFERSDQTVRERLVGDKESWSFLVDTKLGRQLVNKATTFLCNFIADKKGEVVEKEVQSERSKSKSEPGEMRTIEGMAVLPKAVSSPLEKKWAREHGNLKNDIENRDLNKFCLHFSELSGQLRGIKQTDPEFLFLVAQLTVFAEEGKKLGDISREIKNFNALLPDNLKIEIPGENLTKDVAAPAEMQDIVYEKAEVTDAADLLKNLFGEKDIVLSSRKGISKYDPMSKRFSEIKEDLQSRMKAEGIGIDEEANLINRLARIDSDAYAQAANGYNAIRDFVTKNPNPADEELEELYQNLSKLNDLVGSLGISSDGDFPTKISVLEDLIISVKGTTEQARSNALAALKTVCNDPESMVLGENYEIEPKIQKRTADVSLELPTFESAVPEALMDNLKSWQKAAETKTKRTSGWIAQWNIRDHLETAVSSIAKHVKENNKSLKKKFTPELLGQAGPKGRFHYMGELGKVLNFGIEAYDATRSKNKGYLATENINLLENHSEGIKDFFELINPENREKSLEGIDKGELLKTLEGFQKAMTRLSESYKEKVFSGNEADYNSAVQNLNDLMSELRKA